MLSTVFLVAAGLSSGSKIALAAVAAAFILFALVSALVAPRRNPNFPGRAVGWYSALGVAFLVAMIAAVIVFGKERKEASAETTTGTTSAQTTSTRSRTNQATTTTATTTAPTATAPATTAAPATTGNPAAGKKVFTSAGCTGCHTLKDAGATGNIGPNLDQLKPSEATVQHQVEVGGGAMPAFKGQLTPTQIQDVAAYVSSVAGS
jgi:mono/diheme cytochrome c family protein